MVHCSTAKNTLFCRVIPDILWGWSACALIYRSRSRLAGIINGQTVNSTSRIDSIELEASYAITLPYSIDSCTWRIVVATTVSNAQRKRFWHPSISWVASAIDQWLGCSRVSDDGAIYNTVQGYWIPVCRVDSDTLTRSVVRRWLSIGIWEIGTIRLTAS